MSLFFYNIFLLLYGTGAHITALFNPKANLWVKGRKNIFKRLKNTFPSSEKKIWFHCASLGEFEQGRPVLEKLKAEYKGYKILLTFFSPSGYEAQKNYAGADWVFYLPMDSSRNANRFLEIVQPDLVIFIKYEFWFYYLQKIKEKNIPILLISALFSKKMIFFKWYGTIYRKMLTRFDHLFVQNHPSKKLLDEIGLAENCSVSGDTRYDRVIAIAAESNAIPAIEQFIGTANCIVAGSTWPEDEEVLEKAMSRTSNTSLKLIIAPHEINEKHINWIKNIFPSCILYSELKNDSRQTETSNLLVIDNIGLLSRLYKYATIAYIGGGLKSSGVHNVLEAAVYGIPVLFGPYYHKYAEAIDLVKSGGGLPFTDEKRNGIMLAELIEALLINEEEYIYRSKTAEDFVQANKGATDAIINYIQEKRLLTN